LEIHAAMKNITGNELWVSCLF